MLGPLFWVLIAAQSCPDAAAQQDIRDLAREAVGLAFERHVETLYETWMREPTPDHAMRVTRGMERAIRVYLYSRRQIELWRPLCK